MILLIGAAGKTGQAILTTLAQHHTAVRAWVRRPDQAKTARQLGATDVVVGDVLDTAVWTQATTHIRAIYHICPNMHPAEQEIGQLAITAAQQQHVRHFVYHSVLHPHIEAMPHHWHKLRVEEQLLHSGLPFTILQPAAYMQNIAANWPAIRQDGLLRVPYPVTTPFSNVDLRDVAEVAARILTEPTHVGAIYELAGLQIHTPAQMAAILTDVLNRPVTAVAQPLPEWEATARQSGLSSYAINTLLAMFRSYAQIGFCGNSNVLRWLLGREPATFVDVLRRMKDEG